LVWSKFVATFSSRLLKKQIYEAILVFSRCLLRVLVVVTALNVCPKPYFQAFGHTSPRTYAC
jgi:hypothetical protein